ncbi:unnamed protein product [Spirodela intermedia]|uniref:Uncharacterized protein n=2 Tax=Spirodela intermedia TaxID=51605 RepID=A0A7I8JS38_SPIIN|nr:unnamed protein product [Spirodela intermedia]CAA6673027.1 unnamed protein product [Spirodela intermedia]CAA7410238.1 unnamed protein product [Spirodela intermedia]
MYKCIYNVDGDTLPLHQDI